MTVKYCGVHQNYVTETTSPFALLSWGQVAQVFEYSEESKEQLDEAAANDKGIMQSILEVFGLNDKTASSKKQR